MWESLLPLLVQGGSWVFLAVLLATGRLIPLSTHRERVADYKAAVKALEATVAERDRQIAVLLGRVREPTS